MPPDLFSGDVAGRFVEDDVILSTPFRPSPVVPASIAWVTSIRGFCDLGTVAVHHGWGSRVVMAA